MICTPYSVTASVPATVAGSVTWRQRSSQLASRFRRTGRACLRLACGCAVSPAISASSRPSGGPAAAASQHVAGQIGAAAPDQEPTQPQHALQAGPPLLVAPAHPAFARGQPQSPRPPASRAPNPPGSAAGPRQRSSAPGGAQRRSAHFRPSARRAHGPARAPTPRPARGALARLPPRPRPPPGPPADPCRPVRDRGAAARSAPISAPSSAALAGSPPVAPAQLVMEVKLGTNPAAQGPPAGNSACARMRATTPSAAALPSVR